MPMIERTCDFVNLDIKGITNIDYTYGLGISCEMHDWWRFPLHQASPLNCRHGEFGDGKIPWRRSRQERNY